jgi:hypothetical protein
VQGKEGRWTDEVFQVLDATPEDVIAQRDLYDRPPSLFKSWAKGNCVMIGDAVHPMMPNLGQGGCQAIEDAYILAQRLAAVKDRRDIPSTLQVHVCGGCLVHPWLHALGGCAMLWRLDGCQDVACRTRSRLSAPVWTAATRVQVAVWRSV